MIYYVIATATIILSNAFASDFSDYQESLHNQLTKGVQELQDTHKINNPSCTNLFISISHPNSNDPLGLDWQNNPLEVNPIIKYVTDNHYIEAKTLRVLTLYILTKISHVQHEKAIELYCIYPGLCASIVIQDHKDWSSSSKETLRALYRLFEEKGTPSKEEVMKMLASHIQKPKTLS